MNPHVTDIFLVPESEMLGQECPKRTVKLGGIFPVIDKTRNRLHVYVEQVQMDERFALLKSVKEDEASETEAVKRLSRSPH